MVQEQSAVLVVGIDDVDAGPIKMRIKTEHLFLDRSWVEPDLGVVAVDDVTILDAEPLGMVPVDAIEM